MQTSITHCRCCGQPLDAVTCAEQAHVNARGDRRIIPAYTIVTCRNAACTMLDYTFDTRGYSQVDLAEYDVKA